MEEISFPIYYRNKIGTIYTCLFSEEKMEQITINKPEESFRGSILFGFNEQWVAYKDINLMFDILIRNSVVITSDQYDTVYNRVIQGRSEFFGETPQTEDYSYIEPIHPQTDEQLAKNIKHKWKPLNI